jgi:hypothetical protein
MYPEDDITETICILKAVEHNLCTQNSNVPEFQNSLRHLRETITSLESYQQNVPQYQLCGQRESVISKISRWLYPQN